MIPLNLKSIIPCFLLQYYFEITVLALTAKKFKTHLEPGTSVPRRMLKSLLSVTCFTTLMATRSLSKHLTKLCMCVCHCTCVHSQLQVPFTGAIHLVFWGRVSSLGSGAHWFGTAGCPAHLQKPSLCLHSTSTPAFMWVPRDWTQDLTPAQHFSDWAISPAPLARPVNYSRWQLILPLYSALDISHF